MNTIVSTPALLNMREANNEVKAMLEYAGFIIDSSGCTIFVSTANAVRNRWTVCIAFRGKAYETITLSASAHGLEAKQRCREIRNIGDTKKVARKVALAVCDMMMVVPS